MMVIPNKFKLALSVLKISSKIPEPKTYNKAVANQIYKTN